MNFLYILVCCLLAINSFEGAFGAPSEDEIIDLPGLDYPINFRHYSGYLNGTPGRHLHYWFVESQNDPETDPLVLWLNGGPGCSSVSGLLTENGPYFVQDDGEGLYLNPYSWNLIANVLYMESPACVGFSYDDNATCGTRDEEVAEMNYLALKHFHLKFPEYRDREFFITGESYAGIYIPTLGVEIVEGNAEYPIDFQGYAIGNGLTSWNANENSLMFFGRYHAFIGDDLWAELVDRCCENGVGNKDSCNFFPNITAACEVSVLKAEKILDFDGINIYNIYKDCLHPETSQINRYTFDKMNMFYREDAYSDNPELYLELPCIDSTSSAVYLNRTDVREALHIPSEIQPWEICSNAVNRRYLRTVWDTAPQVNILKDAGIRGLYYNGDVDMAVNFIGNQWDIDELGFDVIEDRTQWYYGGQVGGFVIRYDLLDFLTVRGSGHMVPEDKPGEALKMITSFIKNEPY